MNRDTSQIAEERTVFEIARTLDNLKATIFAGLATPEGKLIYANRQALDVVGAQLDQVQGKSAPDTPWLANSSEAQAHMRAAVSSAADGVPAGFEFPYRRKDGRMSTMDLGVKPVIVVAEGVETVAQAHVLQDMGCDRLQGFHFGRPMPAAALAALLPRMP